MSSIKCYSQPTETKIDCPMVSIRRLELHDAIQCAALGKLMHEDSKYAHIEYDPISIIRMVEASVLGNTQTWVAEVGTTLVGLLCIQKLNYFFNHNKFIAQDLAFYIMPAYRNIRLVKQFLTAAEQWCIENDIQALTLGITAPQDCTDTMRLYNHFGYSNWGIAVRKEFV